ncbi:prepilin-type N-terminal cleavage/methylation domain-containing protein [Desemzia sp. RIT804]|uniref:competence type IV pilus minor pilin ComGF n=1 Tax=Desemzia sp. RIT 804 TaxID=2810209 RepID=UPI00194DF825|nr:competence type IV pilus minor pilin ComGF [Desemzia sp. RIT 804]MBM6613357.1 prepilin-type N-terminal cleavage/methylation domain-containing protein [Desemzia sp. RIT 804]
MKRNKNWSFKWLRSLVQLPNSKGFTLLEAIIALLVFALCFSLFSLAVKQVHSINNAQQSDRQLEWHLFLNQFEYDLKENHLKEVTKNQVVFNQYVEKTGGTERVSYTRNFQKLVRQVSSQGYQPMLMQLRELTFSLDGMFLVIHVEFMNGENYRSQINLKSHIEESFDE